MANPKASSSGMSSLAAPPVDFLVCGACQRNFTLSCLQDFMRHKLFDCQGVSLKGMECRSCPEKFQTPWSLLQHAQNTHELKIFLEQGPCSADITSVRADYEDPERLNELDSRLLESSSQVNTTQDTHVIPNADTTSGGALSEKSKGISKALTQDVTASIPQISTHKIVTGISNVTTQSTPHVLYQNSSTNVVASTQLSVAKQPSAHKLGQVLSTANSSPVVSTVLPKHRMLTHDGESINNGRPVFLTPGLADKVSPVSRSPNMGNKVHPVLRTPGAHSISVLQPIKLPPGAILGTSLDMNSASQPRMTFTMLPLGLPLSHAKTTSVQMQKNAISASSLSVPFERKPNDGPVSSPVLAPVGIPVQILSSSAVTSPSLSASTAGHHASLDATLVQEDNSAPHSAVKASTQQSLPGSLPHIQMVGQLASDEEITTVPGLVKDISECVPNTSGDAKNTSQAQDCSCQCCKVGKCVRGVVVEKTRDDSSICPCGPITPSVNNPPVMPDSTVHCCDAPVQAVCSDMKRRKRKNSVTNKKGEEGVDDSVLCCDNQDCGVTIMPGTHEGLKKCCNAVVPKKRKRHMETKHHIKKRAAAAAAAAAEPTFPEQNTIYINIQSSSAIPLVSSSMAGGMRLSTTDGTPGTISSAGLMASTSADDQNPSSLTFSIPVSYTRQGPCSSGSCGGLSGINSADCGCGYCPGPRKFQFTSLRDKKLKTSRRLSASSSESKKEHLSAQVGKQGDLGLSVGVTAENANARESGDEAGERRLGPRKMVRSGMRAGVVGKKRRYPTSRPFKCDQCDHAFNQRIHLKKHQSKHTGIKPFKCEQCDYSTVERSHLKVHIRVHTGEKPYKCSCCEYATAQNSTLKIHLKRHHGDGGGDDGSGGSHTSFSCPICGQEFEDEAPFIQHQQQHPPGTDGGGGDDVTLREGVVVEPEVGVSEVSLADGEEEATLVNGS